MRTGDRSGELLAGAPTDRLGHQRTSTDIDVHRRTSTSCQDLDDIVASPWWRVPLMHSHDDDVREKDRLIESFRVFVVGVAARARMMMGTFSQVGRIAEAGLTWQRGAGI
jgi:hypothetical protein